MREPFRAVSLAAVLVLMAAGGAGAAANKIYIGDQTVDAGSAATIPVLVDTDQVRHGFSVAIKYDQTKIEVTEVTVEGTVSAIATTEGWAFGQFFNDTGKLNWGVVLDIKDPIEKTIPIGAAQVVLNLKVNVKATEAGTTQVVPQDGLGTPTGGWSNILSYRGDTPTHPELAGGTITIQVAPTGNKFIRGDTNADAAVDLSDAIYLLGFLFLGGDPLPCKEAGDVDSSAAMDLSDAIYILNYKFLGGPPPVDPAFPGCDTADVVDCATDTCP